MLKKKKDKLTAAGAKRDWERRFGSSTLCDTLEPVGAPTESTSKPVQYGPRKDIKT